MIGNSRMNMFSLFAFSILSMITVFIVESFTPYGAYSYTRTLVMIGFNNCLLPNHCSNWQMLKFHWWQNATKFHENSDVSIIWRNAVRIIWVMSHDGHGVSNHRSLYCLFSWLFALTSKEIKAPHYLSGHRWVPLTKVSNAESVSCNDVFTC